MVNSQHSKNEYTKPHLVMFADFHGVNTPTSGQLQTPTECGVKKTQWALESWGGLAPELLGQVSLTIASPAPGKGLDQRKCWQQSRARNGWVGGWVGGRGESPPPGPGVEDARSSLSFVSYCHPKCHRREKTLLGAVLLKCLAWCQTDPACEGTAVLPAQIQASRS